MKKFIIIAAVLLSGFLIFQSCFSSKKESTLISVWVTDSELKKMNHKDDATLEKEGIFSGPCGLVKTLNVSSVPPPDSKNFIKGTEKVYEFDKEGVLINQWAMPVDSFLYAVSGQNIIVSYGSNPLSISRDGTLSSSNQAAITPETIVCPAPIKKMYANEDYVRCTQHIDTQSAQARFFVYEGVCT